MELNDSINIEFILKNEYLAVIASGTSYNFQSLAEITRRIYRKVAETDVTFLILDFQQAELKMDWTDSFNLVRMYEKSMPLFTDIILRPVPSAGKVKNLQSTGMRYVKSEALMLIFFHRAPRLKIGLFK